MTVLAVKPQKRTELTKGASEAHSDPRPDQDSHISIKPSVDDEDLKAANDITTKVYDAIDKEKEFFLTSTIIDGVFAIRVVSANPLAEEKYVRQVFDILVKTAEEIRGRRGSTA